MPTTYRCTKTLTIPVGGGPVAVFTRGKLYEGHTSATPGGDWAMQFTNDLGEPHLMDHEYLYGYFERVGSGKHEKPLAGAE